MYMCKMPTQVIVIWLKTKNRLWKFLRKKIPYTCIFFQQIKSLNQEISVLRAKARRTEEDNIKKVGTLQFTWKLILPSHSYILHLRWTHLVIFCVTGKRDRRLARSNQEWGNATDDGREACRIRSRNPKSQTEDSQIGKPD